MSSNRASMVGLEDNSDDEDECLPEADEDPIPKRRRGVNKIYCLQAIYLRAYYWCLSFEKYRRKSIS